MNLFRNIVIFLIIITIFSISTGICYADEFAWNELEESWSYIRALDVYVMGVKDNDDQWIDIDRGVKLLRPAVSSDWAIGTKISQNTLPVDENHHVGLVAYKDAENWIIWGQIRNSTMDAGGVINNQGIGLVEVSSLYNSMQIIKSDNTYIFMYGVDGANWIEGGRYTDSNGYLDGAQYGLMGKCWMANSNEVNVNAYFIQFDYFDESSVVKYEAEDSANSVGGPTPARICMDVNASGGQVVGYLDDIGDYVQFNNVSARSSGTKQMIIRYSNGMGASRHKTLIVNGITVGQITFPATDDWGDYKDLIIMVDMDLDINSIRFERTASDDTGTNIDYILVSDL